MCLNTKQTAWAVIVAAAGCFCIGCENKAQSGALIGAGGGALAGAIIGHQSGHAGAGALIGGAVGAGGGYIVGNEMDKADQREEQRYYQQRTRSAREAQYYDAPRATSAPQGVSRQKVMAWTEEGVKDEIIIDRIERSGTVFRLTPAEENQLRDAGVSEEVIRAMKQTGRQALP